MDTLCLSFQYEGPSLITERTKAAHLSQCLQSNTASGQVLSALSGSTVWTGSLDSLVYITAFHISQHLFLACCFILFRINIHNDERMNTSVFKTHTLVFYTSQDKRLEFVCCFPHDSLIRLLSDHLYPKGKPILSCPALLQCSENTQILALLRT